jgi:hypothetical protein
VEEKSENEIIERKKTEKKRSGSGKIEILKREK